MDLLRVNGIELYAFHGCISEEAKVGGHFTVNTAFRGDFKMAYQMDELSQTIDYVEVSNIVKREMSIRSKLIETVAYRILDALSVAFPVADSIEVTIIKHRAPIEQPVKEVSFTVQS